MTDILSFDVGIINLAYSIINVDNKHNIKIKDIGILNISNNDRIKCNYITRNNKECNMIAKVKCDYINKYYCDNHSKHFNNNINNSEIINNNNICCSYIYPEKSIKCDNKSCVKIYNDYFCNKHKNIIIKNKLKLKKIKKFKYNINELKLNMIKILDQNKKLLKVDEVIIELQPVYKNPMMKSLASHLQAYFMIRGLIDGNIKNVKTISATKKIKLTKDEISQCKNKKEEYHLRKNKSIEEVKKIIINNKKIYDKFDKYNKRDDIADSILQVIKYIS